MTDEELIARLRDFATREASAMPPGWPDAHGLYSDAADRMEALVKEMAVSNEIGRAFEEDAGQQRARAEAAEAKVARLVEAAKKAETDLIELGVDPVDLRAIIAEVQG